MGGKIMIRNLVIIALVVFIFTKTDVSGADIINVAQSTLDKLQELLYIMKEKV